MQTVVAVRHDRIGPSLSRDSIFADFVASQNVKMEELSKNFLFCLPAVAFHSIIVATLSSTATLWASRIAITVFSS
jgi:hypothetical protein